MNSPNFSSMTKQELLSYFLDHRDDQEAFYALMDKFYETQSSEKFPAPKSIDDLKNFPELIRDRQQKKTNS